MIIKLPRLHFDSDKPGLVKVTLIVKIVSARVANFIIDVLLEGNFRNGAQFMSWIKL